MIIKIEIVNAIQLFRFEVDFWSSPAAPIQNKRWLKHSSRRMTLHEVKCTDCKQNSICRRSKIRPSQLDVHMNWRREHNAECTHTTWNIETQFRLSNMIIYKREAERNDLIVQCITHADTYRATWSLSNAQIIIENCTILQFSSSSPSSYIDECTCRKLLMIAVEAAAAASCVWWKLKCVRFVGRFNCTIF